ERGEQDRDGGHVPPAERLADVLDGCQAPEPLPDRLASETRLGDVHATAGTERTIAGAQNAGLVVHVDDRADEAHGVERSPLERDVLYVVPFDADPVGEPARAGSLRDPRGLVPGRRDADAPTAVALGDEQHARAP